MFTPLMQLIAWFNSARRGVRTPDRLPSLQAALERSRTAAAEWKRRYAEAAEKIASLKERLRDTERRTAELHAQAERHRSAREQQQARHARLLTRITQHQTSLGRIKQQAQRLHRGIPSPAVLRGSLPLRLPVAQRRACQPEARQAEQRLVAESAAYAAAVRAAGAPPAVGEPIVKLAVQGLHWWAPALRPRDAEPGSPWLRKQKFPYRGIAQTREVAMGGIMIDLGANIGRMSLPRVILGDVTAAYCAEPDPLNYGCLVRNIVDNGLAGLVLPDNVAIGDREGTATLVRSHHCGAHSLVGTSKSAGETVTVPTTTLDAWVTRLGIDLDLVTFIKMDVQGWEGHVFAGAADVLRRRHVAWQIEFKPALLRAAGTEPTEFCRVIRDHFTHFTDLNKSISGTRSRAIAELEQAVAYVEESEGGQTDLLLFSQRGDVQ